MCRRLKEKHYEGALKQVNHRSRSIDGQHSPADVLRLMVTDGQHAVALKYVHKFGASEQFPPEQLVGRCLESAGELTVRTCAMLLKCTRHGAAFPAVRAIARTRAPRTLPCCACRAIPTRSTVHSAVPRCQSFRARADVPNGGASREDRRVGCHGARDGRQQVHSEGAQAARRTARHRLSGRHLASAWHVSAHVGLGAGVSSGSMDDGRNGRGGYASRAPCRMPCEALRQAMCIQRGGVPALLACVAACACAWCTWRALSGRRERRA